MLNRFFIKFNLTPKEGTIILFLIITLVSGYSYKLLLTKKEQNTIQSNFSYAKEDEIFLNAAEEAAFSFPSKKDSLVKDINKIDLVKKLKEKSININTADKKTLTSLPGIGDKTADKIIEYRNSKKFTDIEEIQKVKGIGKKKYQDIKNYLIIN